MDKTKESLINKAYRMYKTIYPCGRRRSFADCFTYYGNKILFWFDTEDHSTHMLTGEIGPGMQEI